MPFAAGSPPGLGAPALALLIALLFAIPTAGGRPAGAGVPASAPLGPGLAASPHAAAYATPAPPVPAGLPSPWVNRTPTLSASPPAREGAQMAYDVIDGYVLLFGGLANRGGGALRDTWIFQNGSWTNLTGSLLTAPPSRYKGSMAFDPIDREMILYGGLHNGGYLGDTWAFSGLAWTQLTPTVSPGPLEDAGMTFDQQDGYLLLYGGDGPSGVNSNRTYSFVSGAWTDLTSQITGTPPAEETAPLAFDPGLHAVLMFGGLSARGVLNQTWQYRAKVWTNLTGTTGATPPAREAPGMAYDAADGFDLLFGGLRFPSTLSDSWEFHGGKWTKLSPSLSPPSRFDLALTFTFGPAPGTAEVLLFGGRANPANNATDLGDTWTFKLPLIGSVGLSPVAIDLGQSTTVSVSVSGGVSPYSVSWVALPANCVGVSAPGNFSCAPNVPGNSVFVAQFTDGVNDSYVAPAANLTVAPHPAVVVTARPTVGSAPLPVTFTADITGGLAPFGFQWSFGDSARSTAGNTSHTYGSAGNYTANLTVTDGVGMTAIATPVRVQVTALLSANASASAYFGIAPLSVAFTGTGAQGLRPYTFNWSFGATGPYADESGTVYTFTAAGRYPVVLTVHDALGGTAVSRLNVSVLAPLGAAFSARFPQGAVCSNGAPTALLNLSASPSGGTAPYNESWRIGTGTAFGPNPSVVVAGGAGLTVRLSVTDARGTMQNSSEGVSVPTTSCSTLVSQPGPTTFTILWALAAILGVVIILETIVILSGRRKGGT